MCRCDEEQHCKDGTDEQDCSMVVPDIGYNKHLVPFPIKGDTIFYVNVSYEIKRILFIDENENFMRLIYNIQKDWHDRMLTFQNLKKDRINSIFEEDKSEIWSPWVNERNVEKLDKASQTLNEEIFQVVPNEKFKFKHNSKTIYENANLFKVKFIVKIK